MEEFRPASLSPDSSSDESTIMPTPVAAEEGVEEEQVVDDNEEIDVSAEMRRLDELRSSPGEGNLPMRRRESPRLAKKREDIAASVAAAIKKSKRSNNPTNLKATTQAACINAELRGSCNAFLRITDLRSWLYSSISLLFCCWRSNIIRMEASSIVLVLVWWRETNEHWGRLGMRVHVYPKIGCVFIGFDLFCIQDIR